MAVLIHNIITTKLQLNEYILRFDNNLYTQMRK